MLLRQFTMLSAFVLLAAGCADIQEKPSSPPPADWEKTPITVSEVRFPALNQAIGELKGKVVVIDVWATWCPPCVKNFPHLVDIQKRYANKGIVCVSLSADRGRPGAFEIKKVEEFLIKHDARFPNFVLADPNADEAELVKRFRMGPALPFVVVLDREGAPVWTSEEARSVKQANEQLDALLEKLAAGK